MHWQRFLWVLRGGGQPRPPPPEAAPAVAPTAPPGLRPEAPGGLRLDAIQRGQQATRLLHDPVLLQAFADLKSEAQTAWLATRPGEHEKREELYRILQAMELVRSKLVAYRTSGQVSAAQADQEAA